MITYEMEAVLDETVRITCYPRQIGQKKQESAHEKHVRARSGYWNTVRTLLRSRGMMLNSYDWNKEALLMQSRNAFETTLCDHSAVAPVVIALRYFVSQQCRDRLANVVFWAIADVKDDEKVFRLLLRNGNEYLGVIVPGRPYSPVGWYVNDWTREERMRDR